MKKQLLTLAALVCFTQIFAQHKLHDLLSGEQGMSKHLTILDESHQVAFNATNARSIFGLDPNSDLLLINTENDQLGMTHYRYAQTYKGVSVENAMYIAHTKGGLLTAMGGDIVTDFTLQNQARLNATVSPQQAVEAALQYVHADRYAWQDAAFEQELKAAKGSNASYYPVANKVWYGGEQEINPANLVLAYKIDVYSLQPFDRRFIYIDAQTGKVLGVKAELLQSDATGTVTTGYSGAQTIHSDFDGSSYHLRDLTKGKGIITLNGAASYTDYSSPTSNWSALSGQNRWALDAHFGVSATWTFYYNSFGRNSVDGNGYALRSYVNDPYVPAHNGGSPVNAYWDGSVMRYGYLTNGNGLTSIDISGHELTHGVTQFTSNLSYSGEAGAMNESMSDIMGKSVQFYTKPDDVNWQLSNDMNWVIRDMSNPNIKAQPDTYKGTYWVNTTSCSPSGQNDYCGVHTNSGVGNFMFYLLVTGGSGTNDLGNAYAVSGIGLAKADQILYRTNTVYLTPTSGYAAWQQSCISAAADLFGASSNEVAQVKNAWYAVGVGNAPCSPPMNVQASNVTDNTAQISWSAVAGTTGYTLQWKPAAATTFNTVNVTAAAYTLTGLTPGTAYTFQVASACSGGNSSYSAPGTFTTTNTASGGLRYKYYEGTWSALPDFSTLTPVNSGLSANVDISTRPSGRNDNFGFVWEGYLIINTPGTYTFETVSDDGSKLYFNSLYSPSATATVNNDGIHAPNSVTGSVTVTAAGTYPVSITFFEKDGGEQMQVYWTGPGFSRQLIPNSAFTQTPPPSGGLSYKYYEGAWDALPDFTALTPVKTGTSANVDISTRTTGRNDNFAFVWEGYINITTPGAYTFETVSDDGSKLYFNSPYNPSATATVNNDGVHWFRPATGTVNIPAAGMYPISITYFEKDGGEQMQVYWTGPNFARQQIPNSAFTQTPPPPANGLTYKYYEGTWDALPDFSALTPVKTGTSANVDLSTRTAGRNDYFGYVWEGYINITMPGDYTFETISDDGSKLYFNSLYSHYATPTVSNDGLHAPSSATGTVTIPAAGSYPVSITFFEKDGGEQMQVYWSGPNFAREPIPDAAFTVGKSTLPETGAARVVTNRVSGNDKTVNTDKMLIEKIYPNPFTENVTISFYNNSMANDISAAVYDVNGRLLYLQHAGRYALGNNTLKMNLTGSHMAEGFYIIKVTVNGTVVKTEKIMKAK